MPQEPAEPSSDTPPREPDAAPGSSEHGPALAARTRDPHGPDDRAPGRPDYDALGGWALPSSPTTADAPGPIGSDTNLSRPPAPWAARVRSWVLPLRTPGPVPGEDPAEPAASRLTRRLLGASLVLTQATRHARLMGWVWPLAVALFGGVLRFWRLGTPHQLVFDETYYVKEGYSMLARGFEADWGADPNPGFEAGDTSMLASETSERVVHPPLGKWLIAAGIRLGGGVDSSFAWRLAVAVVGTLAILMVARIGRRLFASTTLGTLAGLFMAVDGMAIVMSRTSLLDPFLMVFVLGAFGLLLLDRAQARQRLARRVAAVLDAGAPMPDIGPWLGVRWWRLAAAVLLGLACGVKWSGVYFLAVFGLMSVAWDITARYRVGVRRWFLGGLVLDGIGAGLAMIVLAVATYVATWTSWFVSDHADYRDWADHNDGLTSWTVHLPWFGDGPGLRLMTLDTSWVPDSLRSWWAWHVDSWNFHNTLESEHPYAAGPPGWIIQLRPTSFFWSDEDLTCGADRCVQAVTSVGNPLVWWLGAAAVIVALVWLVWFRDWRAGAVLSGLVAGWLPWMAYAHRTIFTFYAIVFLPWVVLTLAYVIGLVIGPKDEVAPRTRQVTVWVVGGVVGLIVVVGFFFYPVWTAWTIPYDQWRLRMWLGTWV
ncbi:MAG: phospholipid carrier-dependent glycosyltransferase [Micrococcales bacterium]|nr:phospholipid carrier-dependent glycosyltransferase [Micrococcales bacterium]